MSRCAALRVEPRPPCGSSTASEHGRFGNTVYTNPSTPGFASSGLGHRGPTPRHFLSEVRCVGHEARGMERRVGKEEILHNYGPPLQRQQQQATRPGVKKTQRPTRRTRGSIQAYVSATSYPRVGSFSVRVLGPPRPLPGDRSPTMGGPRRKVNLAPSCLSRGCF